MAFIESGATLNSHSSTNREKLHGARSSLVNANEATRMPLLQIKKMSGVELLHHFAEILGKFPPHPNDYPILRGMKRLGFGLGKSWDRTIRQSSMPSTLVQTRLFETLTLDHHPWRVQCQCA